jgi:hypothetical protein
MRSLIISALLLFGAFSVLAQSKDASDYKLVFIDKNIEHFVDQTSLQVVSNGNKVFWSAFFMPTGEGIAVVSLEANCKTRRLRGRSVFLVSNNWTYATGRNNQVQPWFPAKDSTSNKYLDFACGSKVLNLRDLPPVPTS